MALVPVAPRQASYVPPRPMRTTVFTMPDTALENVVEDGEESGEAAGGDGSLEDWNAA